MFCMKCGKKLEKNSHFCPDCGTAVATEAPATPATPVAPAAPVAEPQPVAKPAKPKKKVNVISASLWSIFLTVAVLTIGILNVFVTELTGNAVDEILDNIELSDITLKDTKGGELTLGEFLYHSVDEEMIEKHDLSKKDFDNLLKELDWKDDAADLINAYIGYLVNGESFELEAKDLVDIIENNEDVILETMNGFRFDYDKLEKVIKRDLLKVIAPQELSKAIGYDIGYFTSTVVSVGNIVFWIVGAVSVLAIILATRFSLLTAAQFAGVFSAIIGGSAYVGLSFCASNMTNWLAIPVLATVLAGPLTEAMTVCITVMTIGASLLVGATVFQKLTKKA